MSDSVFVQESTPLSSRPPFPQPCESSPAAALQGLPSEGRLLQEALL